MANIKNITTGVSFAIRYNKLIIYYNLGKLNKKYKKVQVEVNLKAILSWVTLCFFLNKGISRLFFIKDFLEKKN